MQKTVSKGSKRRGKEFEKEWFGGMQEYERRNGAIRIQRFYDLSDYVGRYCPVCKHRLDVCGRCNTKLPSSNAQPPRQPADFETVYKGISILQETKTSKSKASFDTGYIKPHQWSSLIRNIRAGGEGFFIIQNRSNPRDIKVYCVDALELSTLRDRVGHFSIKWAEIERISYCSPDRIRQGEGKNKRTVYDYEQFLTALDDIWKRRERKVPMQVHKVEEGVRLTWGSGV